MREIDGLGEIAAGYDGILFDIWGVIHDGATCFPDAIASLQALQTAGIPYAFLSNMPRRAARVSAALMALGMPEHLAGSTLTSGEAVYGLLSDSASFGRRFYLQGPTRTAELAPANYKQVSNIDQADFILTSGIGDTETPADYAEFLQTALERQLPMICANPDLHVGHGDKLVACAGLLADAFETMGGSVVWMGKPHAAVFKMAAKMLKGQRLLMVGDSLRTDIAGAKAAGLDTLFIRAGIHRKATSLAHLFADHGVTPTFATQHLRWG